MPIWLLLTIVLILLATAALAIAVVAALIGGVLEAGRMKKNGRWRTWANGYRGLIGWRWRSYRVRTLNIIWCLVLAIPLVFLAQTLSLFEQVIPQERTPSFVFLAFLYIASGYAFLYKFGPRLEPRDVNARFTTGSLDVRGQITFFASMPDDGTCRVLVSRLGESNSIEVTSAPIGIPLTVGLQLPDASVPEKLGEKVIQKIIIEDANDVELCSRKGEASCVGNAEVQLIASLPGLLVSTVEKSNEQDYITLFYGIPLVDLSKAEDRFEVNYNSVTIHCRDKMRIHLFTVGGVVVFDVSEGMKLSVTCIDRIGARIYGSGFVDVKGFGNLEIYQHKRVSKVRVREPEGQLHFDSSNEKLVGIDDLEIESSQLHMSLQNEDRRIRVELRCETNDAQLLKMREGRIVRRRSILRDLRHSKLGGLIKIGSSLRP